MKVVVIDDDPTGSQTVHSCPLLLEWDEETLRRGLRHPSLLLAVPGRLLGAPRKSCSDLSKAAVCVGRPALALGQN